MAKSEKSPLCDQKQIATSRIDQEDDMTTDDPETLKRMEAELIQSHPEIKLMLDNERELNKKRLEQAQDPSITLRNKRGFVTPDLLKGYPDSPTAKYTIQAWYVFAQAVEVFETYKKDRVLTESDCRQLQSGFHNYIEGCMLADYLSCQFSLQQKIVTLTKDYMRLRLNDTVAEYFQIRVIQEFQAKGKSEYVAYKEQIRALEKFANKLCEYKDVKSERMMLRDAYYMLGAKYTVTHQDERAVDAFRKCYNLDTSSISALYAVAQKEIEKEPEKAMQHFLQYIKRAPKCDEKYPHAHFCIGFTYFTGFKNENEAVKYYHLGLDAEKHRLPFNPPCDLREKRLLQVLVEARSLQKK